MFDFAPYNENTELRDNILNAEIGDTDVFAKLDTDTINSLLKTVEGMGKFIKRSLIESLKKNFLSMLGSVPALPSLNRFKKMMDYKEYGGALFLGVKKPVVKAHGSSDAKLFEFTVKQAEQFVNNKTVEKLTTEFEKMSKEKIAQ